MRGRLAVAVLGVLAIACVLAAGSQAQAPGNGGEKDADRSSEKAGGDEPSVVRVGALINDIQQLDLATHSYNVDMYVWFRWDDPKIDPSRSFEWLNAFESWGHILTYETGKPERLPDGSYYQVFHNQGKFNTKLPLEKYPFDSQHLLMEFEDASADATDLVYEPDTDPVALSDDLVLPGWNIGEPELRVVENTYDTSFGDPRFEDITYSRAIVDLPVSRPSGTYAFKLLLPMLLVALTAILSLMLHPRYVEGRIGIGITALLTLVALQLTSNSSLPEVDYLILLDKLYIASYGFVVLTMAVIVWNSWVDAEGDVATAKAADRRGLMWLTISYFAVCAFILIQTLA